VATDIDPEGRETQHLFAAADFRGARVLEIGCGAGRLMRRYADVTRTAVGVDSTLDGLPRQLACVQAGAFALPFTEGSFEVVLFGWSL
jgi:cyclopropane fatty-acyl-phospholipid synthase-like methyltransferase